MNILYVISASGLLVCCVVAYLLYYSRAHWIVKMMSLPLVIVLTTTMVYTAFDRMGAPIENYPEGKFSYVFHSVSSDGKLIYIWVETKERGNRLHAIPYNRETAKKLEEAQRAEKQGSEQVGQFAVETEDSGENKPKESSNLQMSRDTIEIDKEVFRK